MSGAYASLGSHRVRRCELMLPAIGTWVADIWTDDEIPSFVTPMTLTLTDLALTCAAVRAEAWQGSTKARLVGGYGGWRKALPARWYSIPAGVRPSVVASDAAAAAGEVIGQGAPTDEPRGVLYARPVQAASRTLYDMGLRWYVAPDGTTSLTPRAPTRVGTVFDVTAYDQARGIVTVASETLASWVPECVFASPRMPPGNFVASAVVHHLESTRVRTDIWLRGARV